MDLQMGIYRHYKGPLYQVLGLAHDANAEGRVCVLYIGLELDQAHLGPRLAVRTLNEFRGHVMVGDNQTCPRFTYLGSELTTEMLHA